MGISQQICVENKIFLDVGLHNTQQFRKIFHGWFWANDSKPTPTLFLDVGLQNTWQYKKLYCEAFSANGGKTIPAVFESVLQLKIV